MKCVGDFVFKSLDIRDGGEFENDQGKTIKFDSCYLLKVDEISEKGINQRILKIDKNNQMLVNKLKNVKAYEHITLICDVVLTDRQSKVIPVDIDSNNK